MDKKNSKREAAVKKNSKKRAARRRRRLLSFFVCFVFTLLCVGAVLCATVFFPVKKIIVSGDSVYTRQDIITASAVTEEDNIIMLSSQKTVERISKALPYSGKITVEKVFPDTVKINVATAVPKYYFLRDGSYCVADSEFKVIETAVEPPVGCIHIKLSETPKTEPGERIEFSDADSELLNKIMSLAKNKSLNITGLDISDNIDLKIIVNDRILVTFGSDTDIDFKFTHFAAMYEKMSEDAQGVANLKNWTSTNTKSTFRDVKIDVFGFCELVNE